MDGSEVNSNTLVASVMIGKKNDWELEDTIIFSQYHHMCSAAKLVS